MRITVSQATPTQEERWTFWISFPQVLLDDYMLSSKTTRQRNYRTDEEWHRIDGRRNTITLREIPQPAYVLVEVQAAVRSMVTVGVPRENARSWSDMKLWRGETPRPQGKITVE